MAGTAKRTTARKPGRPLKTVTPKQLQAIEDAAANGVRESTIAVLCGMSAPTFLALKQRDPRVSLALEKGLALLESEIGDAFRDKIQARDLGAMIWLEKTRFGRRDTQLVQTQALPAVRVVRE